MAWLSGNPGSTPSDFILLIAITSSPLFPVVGFHLNQARLQFRAGHTLVDLRRALDVERRERAEAEAVVRESGEPLSHRVLRLSTIASVLWLGGTLGQVIIGSMTEQQLGFFHIVGPILSTLFFGAASNALDVPFFPRKVREGWQTGIRERLWNSRAGEWLAKRLGAPEQSRGVGANAFRATEAALGVAASELFAALPKAYREQLAELPAIVRALEAQAAGARAEADVLAAMVPSGSEDAEVLAARRQAATAHLGQSVAALERVRLDLLRLHAGASDLSPLTTLLDAARNLGEDISRLAEAQQEAEEAAGHDRGTRRIATPT
jgi:serine/threonine-protein kinase